MQHLPILETARLRLRPFCIDDAEQVQTLAGAFEVYEYTLNVPHPYEEGMAEEWIASHEPALREGRGVTYAIIENTGNTLVGAISLGIEKPHRRAELGYWIGVPFWGQGYCTEAAETLVHFAFTELGLHKLTSRHLARNPASGRVMQKAGMTQEGVLREEVCKDGAFHDLVVYGLLSADFLAAKSHAAE